MYALTDGSDIYRRSFALLLMSLFLFSIFSGIGSGRSEVTGSVISYGKIGTANPNSTPNPTATNLAVIPNDFIGDINGGYAPYASVSYSTTHNGNPSIRIGPDYSPRQTREVNGLWRNLRPGDHVVFNCWIKTDSCNVPYLPWRGGRIGIDLYVRLPNGGVSIIPDGHPIDTESANGICVVPWGRDWTKIAWDFIVPSTIYYEAREWFNGQLTTIPIPGGTQICGCIVWLDARELTDSAYAYFAETELYINP